ncbi:MAG: chemotaxis protein CheA [Thiotrichales bacterium]
MSMDLSEFLGAFFEECHDGLTIMETELLNLDVGAADLEQINTIFRAAHSIKGGSATFGFKEIAGFTHVMETLLDEMRSQKRSVTVPTVDLLLESVDCLREMIQATQANDALDKDRVGSMQQRLKAMLDSDPRAAQIAPTAKEVVAEPPVSTPGEPSPRSGWSIQFLPHENMLKTGNDPVRIMRGLAELGECKVECDTSRLPRLSDLEPEAIFLGWNIELYGEVPRTQIDDLFAWVEGDCDLAINPLASAAVEPAQAAVPATMVQAPTLPARSTPAPPAVSVVTSTLVPDKVGAAAVKAVDLTDAAAPAAPPKPAAPRDAKPPNPEASSIRVSIDKVDALINLVGELVINQSMLHEFTDNFDESQLKKLRDGLNQLTRNLRELQETAMRIRMLPISHSFNRFPRLVRDLSQKLGKKIELKISGEGTELDKTVLEKIGDPLVHLVRNSLDHGIEMPDRRVAAGKPETGVIHLNAYHEGGNIVIEVTDDGAGMNKDRILSKAIERGIVNPDQAMTDDEIYNLIFQPGFSTADQVTDVSGRGVGMDVVRSNIYELGGQIFITSEMGKGSTLSIRLPLTLAILDGQLVRIGKVVYVIQLVSISESIQIKTESIKRVSNQIELYRLRDEYIPIIRLGDLFGIEPHAKRLEDGLLVVVQVDRRRVGLFVDELLGQQQVVIKSLETNFRKIEGLSGATILGDGTVAVILDVSALARSHLYGALRYAPAPALSAA